MELSELKLVTAGNLIKLRTGRGLTQAELGAKLNYSDKTISKWERGEAIPDAYVLTQIAELFGVSVDALLSPPEKWMPPEPEKEEERSYSVRAILAIAVLGVWTLALSAFVALWLAHIICWQIFVVALPVSILTYLVLICVFDRKKQLKYVVALFVLSLFLMMYLLFFHANPWQIFLVAILAEVLVFLSFRVRRHPRKKEPENSQE
ncbi:MAG: helix-turn-helix transcriptional regulator [Oscillospiraceae bacterium]|nr:helix-turn-helix transcriptional regulator [Oscillospiraceae bacterium]